MDFAGLAPAGRSHPLGAEKVAAWPLASLGHRNLTPGLLRQLVAALLHGPALTVSQPGFAGTPESLILRTGPGRLRRPHRKAGRNVQHVPHPQGRQALPEGRRHPEGVVRRDPSSLQVAPLLCPPHHLQGQLRLGPVALPILRHTRRLTPVFVRGPTLGQIQPLVHQCPSQRADIGQEHPRLAVGHLPQPPAVLPGHSHRLPPLLGKVAAVQHSPALFGLEVAPGAGVKLEPKRALTTPAPFS